MNFLWQLGIFSKNPPWNCAIFPWIGAMYQLRMLCIRQIIRHGRTDSSSRIWRRSTGEISPLFVTRRKILLYHCTYHAPLLPSNRHLPSSGDCLEGKGENYQVCSVQYCVQQLCTVRCTHIWTDYNSSLDWVLSHWAHFTVLRFIFVLCITVCCMHDCLGL